MTKLKRQNWFYFATLIFAISLPFSIAFISISIGLLLFTAAIQINPKEIGLRIAERKDLLFVIGVFGVYLLWLVFTNDWEWAVYDLRKNVTYLVLPVAFVLAPELKESQLKSILYTFAVAVGLSSVITLITYYTNNDGTILTAQQYGFMHHIRFSLEIIFAMTILIDGYGRNYKNLSLYIKFGILALLIILFSFLLWHQSLTGLFTLMGTALVALVLWLVHQKNRRIKIVTSVVFLILILLPIVYVSYAIYKFYSVEEVSIDQLDKYTSEGNTYRHDFNNKMIENGHYVWLYVCDKELKEEWNKRSELKYGQVDQHGYLVEYTLIRYLTSKNLRKDAEGVKSLSDDDVKNIENGISNYVLANRSLSIYPRIYVSIWELDMYFKTGVANHKSLAQRIEYTKAAFSIIGDNLWLGVGTGNWKKAYREYYIQNKTQMAPARYGNVHNQYLNYIVKFGIIGFLLIMFFIFYPVIKTKAYRNHLFFLFLAMMMIGNLGDANFETHTGANFLMFFYCLFMVPKSVE